MSHYYTFSFDVYVYHRDLHSFPTRRSSDLLHVRRVHEDLRARRARDLLNAADVVGVPVSADDPRYVADLASEGAQVASQHDTRAANARVDQRQLVAYDEERIHADEAQGVYVGGDLHRLNARPPVAMLCRCYQPSLLALPRDMASPFRSARSPCSSSAPASAAAFASPRPREPARRPRTSSSRRSPSSSGPR